MKRILFSAAIAAALGAGSFAGFRALNPAERQLSDIELANVEALADPNEGEGGVTRPCDDYNGYRRILKGDERVYDCCYKEQVGKCKDDCRRW